MERPAIACELSLLSNCSDSPGAAHGTFSSRECARPVRRNVEAVESRPHLFSGSVRASPTQASEGGNPVTDTPIVGNLLNPKQLLLGSVDGNCPVPSVLGFHLSSDGGSTWKRHCMPSIITRQHAYWPSFDPSVGYDRNGAAYIVGMYNSSDSSNGFIAFQKSADGTHWSKPAVASASSSGFPRTAPFETWFAVDANAGSPRVNSLYVSGVMQLGKEFKYQVLVSHSADGGATWRQAAVDPLQKPPEEDDFTRMTVGRDGTVYVAWLHCRGKSGSGGRSCTHTAHMMFSKSTDGGNTWSPPQPDGEP